MSRHPYRGKSASASSVVLVVLLIMILLLTAALLSFLYLRTASGQEPNDLPVSGSPDLSPSSTLPSDSPSPSVPVDSSPSPSEPAVTSPSPSVPADGLPSPSVPADGSPSPSVPADGSPSPSVSDGLPWYLTLVNPTHSLPEDFTVATEALNNIMSFDARAIGALREMLADCQAAGLQPLVCSAYRSTETQKTLFQRQIDRYMAGGMSYEAAYATTAKEIAVPGTSEHSLGLAADICATSYQLLVSDQENTAEQKWLMAHCAEYGFILRYPKDKEEITGIIYEPWHYRYVGQEAAAAITAEGLCLEEYLAREYGVV